MIRPLRTRHRAMIVVVAIVTGIVLAAALAARQPPATGELPPSIAETAR